MIWLLMRVWLVLAFMATAPRRRKPRRRPDQIPQPPDPEAVSYTVPNCAWVMGVSTRTVWRAIHDGDLPAFRVGRKATRVTRSAVRAYMKSGGSSSLAG